MLRVMLVDDEPLALEGLRLLIDWRAEGFAICAECNRAADALRLLPIASPDLIVTDIRMPGMDGLELMLKAREQGYLGEFVVVSGYGDFEYAKRALHIGVAGYLLKPLESAEAAEVLERVRFELIQQEASEAQQRESRQRVLSALLAGQPADTSSFTTPGCWRLFTWGAPLPYAALQQLLRVFPKGAATVHIVEDREYLLTHWPADASEPDWTALETALQEHRRKLLKSECCQDLRMLPQLRATLVAQPSVEACAVADRVTALARAVALRQQEECVSRCAELETFCATCGAEARRHARQGFLTACASLLADRPESLSTFLREQDRSMESLGLLAIQLLAPEQERASDRVEAYVRAHHGERLTIETVAAALGYNATYLGRLFREERGLGFRDWLTQSRMDKAVRLLLSSDMQVCAIAEQVGYTHYKRFLNHFKQRFGMPPDQFRKSQAPRTGSMNQR